MTDKGKPGKTDRGSVDWTAGMPVGRHGSFTPMGEIEQVGKVAGGLIRLTGWRRTVARLAVLAVLLLMVAGLIISVITTYL
jgi:hypothetical protein